MPLGHIHYESGLDDRVRREPAAPADVTHAGTASPAARDVRRRPNELRSSGIVPRISSEATGAIGVLFFAMGAQAAKKSPFIIGYISIT